MTEWVGGCVSSIFEPNFDKRIARKKLEPLPEMISTGSWLAATDGNTALPSRLGSGSEKSSKF